MHAKVDESIIERRERGAIMTYNFIINTGKRGKIVHGNNIYYVCNFHCGDAGGGGLLSSTGVPL